MAEYIFVPSGARVTSNGKLGGPLYRAVEVKPAKKPARKRARKTVPKPEPKE